MALSNAEKCRRYRLRKHGVATPSDTDNEVIQTLRYGVATPTRHDTTSCRDTDNELLQRLIEEVATLRDTLVSRHRDTVSPSPEVPLYSPPDPPLDSPPNPSPDPPVALVGDIPPRARARGDHAPKEPRDGAKRGTRLAPDWQPSDKGYYFALDAGLDPDATLADFRDFWTAKTERATKLDWEATWRVWCRRERQRARNGHDKLSPVAKLYEGAYRAVCAREARRRAGLADDEPLLDC